jgi:hypothetical protein
LAAVPASHQSEFAYFLNCANPQPSLTRRENRGVVSFEIAQVISIRIRFKDSSTYQDRLMPFSSFCPFVLRKFDLGGRLIFGSRPRAISVLNAGAQFNTI